MDKTIYLKTYDFWISEEKLKGIVVAQIKKIIKEYNDIIQKDIKDLRELRKNSYEKGEIKMDIVYLEERDNWYRERLEYYEKKLKFITRDYDATNTAFDTLLLKARAVPITTLMEFNRAGFAKCLWHIEKTGSMHYNPLKNKIHCFGCGAGGDSIDVCMKLNNLNFKEAVNLLAT